MATEETIKERKSHGGASRQRDTIHRDRQKNPGTSTTPIRPNPGVVQDTEMVRVGLVGRQKAGDFHWRLFHGLKEVWTRQVPGILSTVPHPPLFLSRVLAADTWIPYCRTSRLRSSEGGHTGSMCQIVTSEASTESSR